MQKLFLSSMLVIFGLTVGPIQAVSSCCEVCPATTWCEYRCPDGSCGCGDGDGLSCSYKKDCGAATIEP